MNLGIVHPFSLYSKFSPVVRQCSSLVKMKEDELAKDFEKEYSPFQYHIQYTVKQMKKKINMLKKQGYKVSYRSSFITKLIKN